MLFKDKLKEPVIYKGSNQAINELNQIQEYLKTHTSKELEKKARFIQYGIEGGENVLFELKNSHFPMYVLHDIYMVDHDLSAQIDYIIITSSMVYFIECKNLICVLSCKISHRIYRDCPYKIFTFYKINHRWRNNYIINLRTQIMIYHINIM